MVIPATHRRARVSPLAPTATIGRRVGPFADPLSHSAIHLYFTSPLQFRPLLCKWCLFGKRDACATDLPSLLFSVTPFLCNIFCQIFIGQAGEDLGRAFRSPNPHPLPLPTFLIIIATLPHKQPPFHISREPTPTDEMLPLSHLTCRQMPLKYDPSALARFHP